VLSSYGFGWFARFTRSSFVDCDHPEFVLVAFSQVLYGVLRIGSWIVVDFDPFSAAFSLLDVVPCDGFTTGGSWRVPLERARRWSKSGYFGLAWSVRWIERTLRDNRFAFQRFRNAVDVLGAYSEDVLLALGQAACSEGRSGAETWTRAPTVSTILTHFDDIAADLAAAVVIWRIPRQRNAVLSSLGVLQRTSRDSRFVDDDDFDVSLVGSVFVLGLDGVLASIVTVANFHSQSSMFACCLSLQARKQFID
jgi:hypothetical protein